MTAKISRRWIHSFFRFLIWASILFSFSVLFKYLGSPPEQEIAALKRWVGLNLGDSMFGLFFFFLATHFACSVFSLPGLTILNIFAGAYYGLGLGLIIVSFSTLVSALSGYFIGRWFAGASLPNWMPKIKKEYSIHSRLGNLPLSQIIELRLSPLIPYGVLNILLGWAAIPMRFFLIALGVSSLLDVLFLVSVGHMLSVAN